MQNTEIKMCVHIAILCIQNNQILDQWYKEQIVLKRVKTGTANLDF